ncbi:hypothetical protein B0O80DRAFT_206490 [Mortierella sp. GBAus27b]|nr:hypothetical protein B0O80DRAFT_206490 [Mortierella sp. GBAus27b]
MVVPVQKEGPLPILDCASPLPPYPCLGHHLAHVCLWDLSQTHTAQSLHSRYTTFALLGLTSQPILSWTLGGRRLEPGNGTGRGEKCVWMKRVY